LESGRLTLEATAADLIEHADVQQFYLGTSNVSGESSYADVKSTRRRRRRI
jgi:hypothetical protein